MESVAQKGAIPWESRPLPHLLRLSWPIVVSMLSYSVMTLVDTIFVARLGQEALAGVGLGGVTYFVLMCFPMGTLYAVKTLVSQALGAGHAERAPLYLGAGLKFAVVVGLAMTAIGAVGSPFLRELTASAASGAAASEYLQLRSLGLTAVLTRIAIEQARTGLGDSRSPMRAALITNVVNIGLDYLFIVVLERGVAGAAVATVIANVIGLAVMAWLQRPDGFGVRAAGARQIRAVLSLGLPSGVQMGLEVTSYSVVVAMLSRMSDLDAAANQIGIQIFHFAFLPYMAIGEGTSVMAGQAVGAGRRDLVGRVAAIGVVPILCYSSLCGLAFWFGDRLLASAFTDDAALVALAANLLRIGAAVQLLDGSNILARTILRGTGDVRVTAWLAIGLTWVVLPPLTWTLGATYGLGAVGAWYALGVELTIGAALFWTRLLRGHWHVAADRALADGQL